MTQPFGEEEPLGELVKRFLEDLPAATWTGHEASGGQWHESP